MFVTLRLAIWHNRADSCIGLTGEEIEPQISGSKNKKLKNLDCLTSRISTSFDYSDKKTSKPQRSIFSNFDFSFNSFFGENAGNNR